MIKAKQVFFRTYNLKGHGLHGDHFYLTSEYYPLYVLSGKLNFLEIGPVNQKLSEDLELKFSRLRRYLRVRVVKIVCKWFLP